MMNNGATLLEMIMSKALLSAGIFFAEQVFVKTDEGHYIFDFVVFGNYSKIVVECDGPNHYNLHQWAWDAQRDQWTVQHGFQEVLRFSEPQIRNAIDECVAEIKNSLAKNDALMKDNPSQFIKIQQERERIKNRNRTYIYEGERITSKWSGLRVILEVDTYPKHNGLVYVGQGIAIPEHEVIWYQKISSLPQESKRELWRLIKSATLGYAGINQCTKTHIELEDKEIIKLIRKVKIWSVKVLPKSPNLYEALRHVYLTKYF